MKKLLFTSALALHKLFDCHIYTTLPIGHKKIPKIRDFFMFLANNYLFKTFATVAPISAGEATTLIPHSAIIFILA